MQSLQAPLVAPAIQVREDEGKSAEWNAYVAAHSQANFFHQYEWLKLVQEVYGGTPHYLAAYQAERVVGVLPLMQRRVIGPGSILISVPFADEGGLIADNPQVEAALLEAAREVGERVRAGYVELRQAAPVMADQPCDLSRVALRLALPTEVATLWEGLSKNMRKKVKRAQRDGLVAHVGGAEALEVFYQIYSENMRDLGSPMHALSFFQSVFSHFSEQAFSIVIKTTEQEVAGAAVAVQFGEVLTVLCAHSLRRHYQLFPNNLLYWALFEEAIARGCTSADFGRSPRGTGIYEFKKLWGMEDRQLYYEMMPISRLPQTGEKRDGRLYQAFSVVWQKTPLAIARVVGPKLFARLPI
jgi:serine/alanine adding enzyme